MTDTIKGLMYATGLKDVVWPKLPVIVADAETGEIVFVHEFAASLFGYTVEELTGKKIEMVVPIPLQEPHSVWRRDVLTPRMRLMGLGRQVYGLRKDGSIFPVIVLLTSEEIEGRVYGVALVVDLTGILLGKPTAVDVLPIPEIQEAKS